MLPICSTFGFTRLRNWAVANLHTIIPSGESALMQGKGPIRDVIMATRIIDLARDHSELEPFVPTAFYSLFALDFDAARDAEECNLVFSKLLPQDAARLIRAKERIYKKAADFVVFLGAESHCCKLSGFSPSTEVARTECLARFLSFKRLMRFPLEWLVKASNKSRMCRLCRDAVCPKAVAVKQLMVADLFEMFGTRHFASSNLRM